MTRKQYVLVQASALAIAAGLMAGPSPAVAQSFQGTASPVGASVDQGTPGQTNVTVNQSQAVIDWTPNPDGGAPGTAINFQPAGTVATFNGASDYAVLNRINVTDTSRIVAMSGTIQSFIGGEVTGGSVYFYSPSGFVIGSSAIINVGSLVLSASPITVDGNGFFITGPDNTVEFGAAPDPFGNTPNPNAQIYTNPGSQISALNENSYVALVAPRVEHHGTISVNGAAALVAAEAATMNFRTGGLFDIQIDVGTTDPDGIVVDGTITGPSGSGFTDTHRAYLVAVPKNTAMTMLIGSGADLGFDIAGAADVVGNAVVLSAGHDISFGGTVESPSAASGADANISIGNANFTSALYGRADGDINARAVDGSMTFASDASLRARDLAILEAWGGGSVSVANNLTISANATGSAEGESATAGNVTLQALGGGTVSVTGSTDLSAVGTGGFSNTPGITSGDGTGGTILVQSTSTGNITLNGTLTADASGEGGGFFSDGSFIDGGDGFGGTVNVFTSGDSSMTVAGAASLTGNGIAGQPNDCFQCGGIGGVGDAGAVTVQAHTDFAGGPENSMAFAGSLVINANGLGGTGLSGGLGSGGNVTVSALSDSGFAVGSDLSISAYGEGGNAFGDGGDGGAGLGGIAEVAADDASLAITGSHSQYLDGNGGFSEGGNGGDGQGGSGEMFANNGGAVAVGLYSSIDASGNGGEGFSSGGEGHGGLAYYSSSNGGTLTLGSFSSLITDGRGGGAFDADGLGGNGGLGEGGHAEAYANDGVVNAQSTLWLSANGRGGSAGGLRDAGDSLGGDIFLQALNDGSFTIAGGLYATAIGVGDYINSLTNSGDGTGGSINIFSRDGDSTLTVSGDANLDADGEANRQGECFPCGGVGGIGQGGNITIASQGATGINGNVLTFAADLDATANGYGGGGVGGAAGDGFGGNVTLTAADGNAVNVTGDLRLEVIGFGGFDAGGFVAGDGTGGFVRISTFGTGAHEMNLSNVVIDASGFGGDSELLSGGTGGNGEAGRTRVIANGGAIAVTGDLLLRSNNGGGSGDIGGNGIALIGANPINTATSDARVVAYGGSINVTGLTTLDVAAFGGPGANGGSGGDASGGYGTIHARNSDLAPSTITLGTVIVNAEATGGAGGAGISGPGGTAGGDGGSASGGFIVVTAAAGNGHVMAGNVILSASAFGGGGGDSGNGDNLSTGDGGDGGQATGGTIFAGAETGLGEATLTNTGTANFGNVIALADAAGGNGGFGNFGTPGGNGGAGGSGDGGLAVFQTRGALVTVGAVTLEANGTGGDGGGSEIGVGGVGGDGFAGEVGVIATNRAGDTSQRGTLNVAAIFGNAIGTGGSGSTPGASLVEGGSIFQVENADATIGSVDIVVDGVAVSPGSDESRIVVIDGTANITTDFFAFSTIGDLSLYLASTGIPTSLTAGNLILTAGDFVPDSVNLPPANPGTIFANSAFITTGNNFIADANLDIVNDLTITAPGLIQFNGAVSDGSIDLWAQGGSITVDGVDAGATVNLLAAASVTTDDILAGAGVSIEAQGGSILTGDIGVGDFISLLANGGITTGDLLALTSIDLDATGDVLFGDAQADDFDFSSGGAVAGGNIVAGTNATGEAEGAVNLGDISVGIQFAGGAAEQGFAVGMTSATSVDVGDVEADESIGFATLGSLTTGDLNAGADVLTLVGDNTTIASITTPNSGRTYLADVSMFFGAGGPDNFDPALVLAATPVQSGGALILNGPVSTGQFQAAAASIAAGNITAPIGIYLDSAGGIATGNMAATSGDIIATSGGGMTLADLTAGSDVLLDSGASISLGNVTAQTGSVQASAVDVLSFLAITAGTFVTIDPTLITGGDITALAGDVTATGDAIDIGNVSASDNVILTATAGNLSTLAIDAGLDVTLNATGDVTTGDIAAGGLIDATGASLTLGNLSANSIDLTTTVADLTVGNVTIPGSLALTTAGDLIFGDLSAFDVDLAATGSMAGGDIDSATDITALSGTTTSIGNLVASGNVSATGGSLALGDISGNALTLTSNVGNLDVGDILAFSGLDVSSAGDFNFGSITAPLVDLNAPGSIIGGFIDSDTDIIAVAGVDIDVGDLTAGGFDGEVVQLGDILLTASGDISAGLVSAEGVVSADAGGSIATLDIDALDFVQLFASSGILTGDIFAGDFILADAGGSMIFGNLDADAEIELVADGSITINGTVSTGLFQAAAGTGLTTGSINANTIEASAGATATLNGLWSAENVTLASNDIDISGTGGISGSSLATLISTNATQALIGDGLTGTGYALSNAEFGRIEGGSVFILARGDASAAIDMLIGDLTVTGPSAGSTIENSEGILVFATGDAESQAPAGVIRVTGDIAATGFGSGNAMEFHADRFELDAATGSISLTSSGGVLAGELGLYADQTHVAEGSILDQLAVDPQYAGYQDDLNAPAAVQRPEGVLNASVIWIESDNLQNILIQNTGTAETPAGFLANEIFVNDDFEIAGPPGSIDVVVNGQLQTEGGTLTGIDVRDALVEGEDLSPFTENSTINGCLLAGPCGEPDSPFPPGFTPTPGIQQEIRLINLNLLPPPEFGNENLIDDNDELTEEGETSPIEPPQPLFDTSALGDKGDVDDPVSGSGNPSLMETPPPSSNQEKQP